MKKWIELDFLKDLKSNLKSKESLIQVVIGPRQVGKTTSIQLYLKNLDKKHYHYISADGDIQKPAEWLFKQWTLTYQTKSKRVFVVDEIQKVENWSEMIKKLWDEQKQKSKKLKVVLLGSSSLQIQKGLSESLAGRYNMHFVYHWNFQESQKAFRLSFEDYLIYGGYPRSYAFLKNKVKWLEYIKYSIVEPVIGKDILLYNQVKSPALFKQCFDLICSYPAQEISYTKLLGQLQSKGNVEVVKHYIELFEQAFLVKQLFKYSEKQVLTRSSSPKILPLCPALFSINKFAVLSPEEKGRMFELVVGMALNRLPGNLFYWREKNYELDYVYQFGKKLFGIEVKSHPKKSKALMRFKDKFPNSQVLILSFENYIRLIKKIHKESFYDF